MGPPSAHSSPVPERSMSGSWGWDGYRDVPGAQESDHSGLVDTHITKIRLLSSYDFFRTSCTYPLWTCNILMYMSRHIDLEVPERASSSNIDLCMNRCSLCRVHPDGSCIVRFLPGLIGINGDGRSVYLEASESFLGSILQETVLSMRIIN